MTHDYNIPHTAKASALHRALLLVICFILSFTSTSLAQTIGGNVYGAGNQGDVGSSSTVTLKGGTIKGDVYGGAREADVAGRTFVDVNATSTLLVKGVYGGNDVSGTIGTSTELPFSRLATGIDNTWNSFVRIANNNNTHPVIIGSLYGGGNGAYTYDDENKKPVLGKTYLEIQGGIFGNIYGGGNNATVTGNTVIYMNNQLGNLTVPSATLGDFKNLFDATDYSTNGENITFKHHVSRMFGGNNLAEMNIRPTWHLQGGSINNLYSGGNRGAMTNENGILLPLTSADLTVNNVYGGCRIADVDPGKSPDAETFNGHNFPEGYATRVYISAGSINNVYGGNDISGKVHYGTNLAIFSNIEGEVYGGGNGSYAYTDKITTSDYYYAPGSSSIESLFNFRPHIEKTLIHVEGKDAAKPITLGGVYCGGNSATLYKDGTGDAAAKFRIGKNVTIGNVFLGSNGANMVSEEMLTQYAGDTYNSINLTEQNQFNRYMDGVAVDILPNIEWEEGLDYTTRIGSFFCGGNIGSMTYAGVAKTGNSNHFEFPAGITITDKIVAGCNNANIAAVDNLNAAYEGGLTGTYESGTNDKVRIKVLSRLEPTSTKTVSYQDAEGVLQENESVYQGANVYGGCYKSGVVNGNVVIDVESDIVAPDLEASILKATGDYIDASALAIYGGGFGTDAVIKGNTQINLTNNARVLFVFGGGEMGEVTGNTTVKLDNNLNFTTYQNAYKVYAGGYAGPVDGNTTLNLLGGSVMSAFAGACNANIGGTTEAIIGAGTHGVPYVTHAVYGGNDFGGHIGVNNTSSKLYENITVPDGTKNVRTQTYVKYVSGKIGRAIYGGSYGSYAYNNQNIYGTLTNHKYPTIKTSIIAQQNDPEGTILTNTFVDIASTSDSPEDVIGSDNSESVLTMLAGGGRGYKGLPDYVEVGQTYLLLHGASYAYRNNQLMAHRVYGGGNLSKVGNTRIDAYSGSFGAIFGGTHGVKTEVAGDLDASYDCGDTKINYYGGMDKADMNLYGTGANSGATGTATINLYGGKVNNVYGGSLAEGYTANTVVNVPETSSNLQANALFGGALGEEEGRPCDVGVSNVTFASTTATVEDGIYGGNHTARATKETNVTISVPVKSQSEILQNIFGAGYGAGTVAGFTHVILNEGAEVARVYGGGREGKVYNHYKYSTIDGYSNNERQATWETEGDAYNTLIDIHGSSARIAHVTGNVYGAGYGAVAHTSGKTKVQLLGGTVDGDIYGGGEMGTMPLMNAQTNGFIANTSQVISTLCAIEGGQVRNVFGGGYQGRIEGNSGVSIGTTAGTSFFAGVPTILRSAYGGGEMAVVTGTSTVNMYNGYIGYRYHADAAENNKYQPELKLNADDEANLLSENGNLYGAGFGEGAVVMNTQVRLYGGTIRNGLYGGGEIAAVGDGERNDDGSTYTVNRGGQTNVYMYGGLVVGDVFGGGRGYSYDLTGNQVIGKTLYSDGYVFGKTNVEIYRGTIGTDESLALGHGNVFGGGNIGYVYSAGVKYTGETDGTKIKGHYYTNDNYTERTEDCRVHIAAGALVTADDGVTINNHSYSKGQLVPNADLNTLTYNADNPGAWASLDNEGVTIRNAVFAGGNVSAGSDKVYANAVTVFGNATAAVVDVFSRDLVTLGGEHVGGLYGDGNLTFVDGYRELNITNYGTDYYHLNPNNTKKIITKNEFDNLSAREKAYYTAEKGENDVIQYTISRTSGRMMNTIQRADFCGVFGCRILLHGAQDRVPDVADYTNYTINRVGEVSLNCITKSSVTHGNYFGIYNVVNLLGALTSDVEFTSNRKASKYTETTGESAIEPTTSESYIPGKSYYDFKDKNYSKGFRNKANSLNMVALASGVYLELVEEETENKQTGEVTKTYGPITGVIELDLINVRTGEGGGYVYAKNEHRSATPITDPNAKKQQTLSTANQGAITQKAFTYTGDNSESGMQTSGNFVHDDYRIVDDCFPNGGDINSPAHFWYVIGNYYVYDQKLSAYTGGANAYEQSINIPFTITDGSNGRVQITSIKPNKYFVGADGVTSYKFGGKEYHLNDIISYWDWTQLPQGEDGPKSYFVDMTYIAQSAVGSSYQPGDVISATTYNDLSDEEKQAFRISNEMSRDNGYLLTYGMTNPLEWDTYFTKEKNQADKLLGSALAEKTESERNAYLQAPTIQCTESGIYGQRVYNSEDLVSQAVIYEHKLIAESTDQATIDAYQALSYSKPQAQFDVAYVATREILIGNTSYNVGSYISNTVYTGLTTEQKTAFEEAYLCIQTIEVAEKDYVLNGELISETRYDQLSDLTKDANDSYMYDVVITDHFSPAYVCVRQDPEDDDTYYYGGTYFEAGTNYSALDICALSHNDRQAKKTNGDPVFVFNKDALDLFYTDFSDDIKGYGSPYYEENQYLYVDFEATYTGNETSLKKTDGTSMEIQKGQVLNREAYKQLLNEQAHYVKVTLSEGTNYIVKTQFKHNNTNYLVGTVVDEATYNSLSSNNSYLCQYNNTNNYPEAYFCREDYKQNNSENNITQGTVITTTEYEALPNEQKDFSIVGRASTETSTLYVPRESDIENLSKDRIITVQLEYVYNENGEEKLENHVVNIHVQFKSGQPTIGSVAPPATVLPNTTVGLSVPTVTPGAYEIIGGGWEIFKTENDARAHKNGATYRNNATPMYWYQNGYYVAYFAKTYLGKVYSNPVRFTIANYHRLSEVMNHKVGDKNEYMYIDHEHANRDRAPKIYLDAAGSESTEKNDLDYLIDLYNVTIREDQVKTTDPNTGKEITSTIREVDERIKGGANLEFILRSDIAPKTYNNWTPVGPVGTQANPFAGTFHGNGYTISGLGDASLFGHLGGKVYNLGVNGGNVASTVAEGGRIENVWVSATTPVEFSGANVVNYHFLTNENAASFAKGEVAYTLNSFYAPNVQYNANGYVEKYFADGDFIYADGIIPLTTDVRYQNGVYKPLADDYIFFGQRLTYANATHENLPNRINKVGNAIDRTANSDRVYRASAYYMNKTESDIFFNTDAKFVDTYDSKPIHLNLTAIDFTDNNVDMEQLLGFSLDGLTRNLLVYAEDVPNNPTYGNVSRYLNETALSISSISDNNYKTVAKNTSPSRGHLVTKQSDDSYVALTDHFLVDKENFNVPIEYSFASGKRMWYQREPDRFAVAGNGNGDGWDIICLPFTAELVTTHEKGEITHFYQGSTMNHEYWLREFSSVTTENSETKATFTSLTAGNTTYTATSTFLHDTYYQDKNDANADSYQQNHYASAREYKNYAYLQANTPYIIAFPDQSYHEFDMSGNFVPEHTATSIGRLDKQVVTFVSTAGATIGVTDDATLVKAADGYDFVGTHQTKAINNGYLLNAEGSAFERANDQSSVPFRGYITTTASGAPKRIFISGAAEEEEPAEELTERGLTIYGKNQAIYIESTLEHEATLTIFTMSGQLVKEVTVQPMSKEVVTVTSRGIYLVNNRKVAVL
ncbi:MAG: hypothetical protein IKL03_09065 [Bacteroidaceae bacterium]|nr:hypothetical protein [Bacteroidaceae bacterium]